MKKTTQGRQRATPTEMPSDVGRLMFHDLLKYKGTPFSPFDSKSYLSKKFFLSREEYQKMDFGPFLDHAERMAKQARATLTQIEQMTEKAKFEATTKHDTPKTLKDPPRTPPCSRTSPKQNEIAPIQYSGARHSPESYNTFRVKSLRDTIVAPYPNNEMAIVIFELDGEVDANSVVLQFADNGQQIAIFSRVTTGNK